MNTNIMKYLLISASIFSAIVLNNGTKAMAQTRTNSETSRDQIEKYNNINSAEDSLDQVTDVNELTDVKTTDWAYQSLKSLAEKYGCLEALPNNTYQGNRSITRYEFASGLNTCLAQIEKLIAASTSNLIRKEDLATLGKLQGDFSPELAVINKRLDSLEASTEKVEKSKFSTTAKLNGEVVTMLNGVASGAINGTNIDKNTALGTRARLHFDTSFTGEDLLKTRLQITNQSSLSNITGTP
ncbi:MAG TPA: iron uptake porin, partial [Allocoleopsis sp.]